MRIRNRLWGNLLALVTLLVFHLSTTFLLEPGYSQQPFAWVVHTLVLLGYGTFFFGFLDLAWTAGVSYFLDRDQEKLLQQFGNRESLTRFLEGEGDQGSSELGAGVVAGSLKRMKAQECITSENLKYQIGRALQHCQPGSLFLAFSIRTAPVIGLLGTVLGLKLTFETKIPTDGGSFQVQDILPFLGAALVTTMMGLAISFFGALVKDWVVRLMRAECEDSLGTVIHPMVRTLDEMQIVSGREPAGRSHSPKFARFKWLSGAAIMAFTLTIVILANQPDGMLDSLVMIDNQGDKAEISESTHIRTETPQQADKRAIKDRARKNPDATFERKLSDLLLEYQQALIEQDSAENIYGYHLFQVRENLYQSSGSQHWSRTFDPQKKLPIAGILHLGTPTILEKIEERYPTLIARFDYELDEQGKAKGEGKVTYVEFIRGQPFIRKKRTGTFTDFLDSKKHYDRSKGYLLDRQQLAFMLKRDIRKKMEKNADRRRRHKPENNLSLWFAFDHQEKLQLAFDQRKLKGSMGDFIVFYWQLNNDGPSVNKVESLSPNQVHTLLKDRSDSRI